MSFVSFLFCFVSCVSCVFLYLQFASCVRVCMCVCVFFFQFPIFFFMFFLSSFCTFIRYAKILSPSSLPCPSLPRAFPPHHPRQTHQQQSITPTPFAFFVRNKRKVSEPSGARLAPGKNALLVGCRGFATLQVSVSTFEEEVGDMWKYTC